MVCRIDKCFTVNVSGQDKTISVDRLKPAFILAEDIETGAHASSERDDRILVSLPGPPPVTMRVFRAKPVGKLPTGSDMAVGYVSPTDCRPVFRELHHWQGVMWGLLSPPCSLTSK